MGDNHAITVYKPLDSFKRWGGQNDYTITKGGLLRIQNVILQILDGPLILIPSFNAIGVRGIPMKRILWKGRMVEICVQFAVIFGPFLQVGFNDAAVGRTLNVTHCKSCLGSVQ